jgi:hypothetical protein
MLPVPGKETLDSEPLIISRLMLFIVPSDDVY